MLIIDPTAKISPLADIERSVRGTKIQIGARTLIDSFVKIKPVGGMGECIIGDDCAVNSGTVIYTGNGITMGNYVLLAPGVMVMPTNHAFASRHIPIRHQGFQASKGGITIEDDVWIGANSVILDGTHIGKGAIIAAGSVVRGTVPPNEIWGGIMARKIKDRPG